MSKNLGIFTIGLFAGASAVLALCPSVRRETLEVMDAAKRQALEKVDQQRTAIVSSVEAAKSTYENSVRAGDVGSMFANG